MTTVAAAAEPALQDRALSWLINDSRDAPFVRLMISATLVVIPFAVALYVPGVFRWWLAVAYVATNFLVFLDRFILMLHNTSHRALFKPRFRWLNSYIPWVLGPFFGQSPETYFAHHLGMHHPENNLAEDLSSTMEYQRDSVRGFALYYGRFMYRGLVDLTRYLQRKNRARLRTRLLSGEGLYWAASIGLAFLNWRATLVVFVIPVVLVRFLMMAGNWGQHAFVDASEPESAFKNSITVLAERYNRRCFNDGYHIGHHIKANRHWTEMPGDFESNRATYAQKGAIVFEGIDFFAVWFLLMLKRYGSLAKHYVVLEGERPSEEAIVALLRSRTQAIVKGVSVARRPQRRAAGSSDASRMNGMHPLPRNCACHSGLRYTACCAPAHRGDREASTPEALMRSRYAAFALGLGEYLIKTLAVDHPDRALPQPELLQSLSRAHERQRFLALAVLHASADGDTGEVLFHARIFERGLDHSFAELSTFRREGGGWRYASGVLLPAGLLPNDLASLDRSKFLALSEASARPTAP